VKFKKSTTNICMRNTCTHCYNYCT